VSASSSAPVRIVVMEGDGIGPEITAATIDVLRATERIFGLDLAFSPMSIGFAALRAHGTTLPDAAIEAARTADGVILGPVSHNDYPPAAQGGLNPSGELRSASISTPISGRRRAAAAFRRAAARRSIS
jgi:isocitrate/isopropylmalate dehydrogenase